MVVGMAASPRLLERNHHAVTLDPDSLKLKISLSGAGYPREEEAEAEEEEVSIVSVVSVVPESKGSPGVQEASEDDEYPVSCSGLGIPWDESLYESLRLCRKRAYCKVQSKRRLHLPACLSIYLHREWRAIHPEHKIKPRDLLDIYETRFEGGSKRRKPYVRKAPVAKKTAASESHSDKVSSLGATWTPSKLMHLSLIGQKVERLLAESPALDYSSKLREEWLKYYPESPLSGRNLKARLFLYNKTRPEGASSPSIPLPELPPPNKKGDFWNKEALDLLISIYNQLSLEDKSSSNLPESLFRHWKRAYRGKLHSLSSTDLLLKVEELLEKDSHRFSSPREDESALNGSLHWQQRLPLPPRIEWACERHWAHVFEEDTCPEISCSRTEDLVKIRDSLSESYPNCDIFEKPYHKTPRKAGLVGAIFTEWGRLYPEHVESVRSLVMKLYKYDRIPDASHFVSSDNRRVKQYFNGGDAKDENKDSNELQWTKDMILHLRETREFAEIKAEENANGTPSLQAVTRIWKNRWKSIYPNFPLDWKSVVEKYTSLETSDDLGLKITKVKSESSVDLGGGGSSDTAEVKGFRQWNLNMKQGLVNTKERIFQSLHPQTIDPQSKQFATLLFNEFRKLFPKCMESTRSLLSKLQSIEKEGFTPIQVEISSTVVLEDPVLPNKPEESKGEVHPSIMGFPDWNVSMIRDFISCMDVARRKYSSLKSAAPQENQPRLIPLLLNEWKIIYPKSTETDKTFLEKIKHLKVQKEAIKTVLAKSNLPSPQPEKEKILQSPPPESSNEDKVPWNQSMMEDVIRTRDIALKRLGEDQNKGKRVSFHHTWWEEFRRIYPNCSFGKNSLSAHYWRWKKTQEFPSDDKRTETQQAEKPKASARRVYSNWSKEDKEQLLDLAFKLQKNQADQEALRNKGFGAVLRDEWKALRPDRLDHPSTLNLLYAKYLKSIKGHYTPFSVVNQRIEGASCLRWTPRHNRALRQCVSDCPIQEGEEGWCRSIIDAWRKLFPGSILSDEEISLRLSDYMKSFNSRPSWSLTPEAKKYLNILFVRSFRQTLKRRRLRRDLIILPQKRNQLAEHLHGSFLQKFPDCPLSPLSLLNECDLFRSRYSNNSLGPEDKEEDQNWNPLMIQNMLETRRAAIHEKRNSQNPDAFNVAETWYQKFLQHHPNYTSPRRNLIRKFRRYRAQAEEESSLNIHSEEEFFEPPFPEDLFEHIRTLLSTPEIPVPPKLPPKEELLQKIAESSSSPNDDCFHFPGGARLIPIHRESIETDSSFPSDVQGILQDMKLSIKDFDHFFRIYADAREEYISFLKKGYIVFFPFCLQVVWSRRFKDSKATGRGLCELAESLLDKVYSEEVLMDTCPSEVVTKVSQSFNLNEFLLQEVLSVFSDEGRCESSECSRDLKAFEKWKTLHPKLTLSFKELVSLHRMLLFEKTQRTDLLENLTLDCAIADIYSEFTRSKTIYQSKNLELEEEVPSKYDESNVSIEQLRDWYRRTQSISSSQDLGGAPMCPGPCPHYGVKNIKLFWSHERIRDLELCFHKADLKYRRRKGSPRFRLKASYISLMESEWKKLHPDKYVDKRILVGKYISTLRRKMSERNQSENVIIHTMNLDAMDHIESINTTMREHTTSTPSVPPHHFVPQQEEIQEVEEESLEFDLQTPPTNGPVKTSSNVTIEEVLQKIDEKGRRSAVWTSEVMRDLLKARDVSKRRKRRIEQDPKLTKTDNLFVEEWKKVRPDMGHMSIWTLNAYVRKFDQFRNKLLEAKQKKAEESHSASASTAYMTGEKRRKRIPIRYFPNSSIPVYDLEVLLGLKAVSKEVKDLIFTRQRAMEAKLKESPKLTLDYLWPQEWTKLQPSALLANQLRNMLWSVERFPSNMERLRVALLRSSSSSDKRNYHYDHYRPILPRRYIFPEDQLLRNPFKFSQRVAFFDQESPKEGGRKRRRMIITHLSLSSESLSSKECGLDIPKVTFEKQFLQSDEQRFPLSDTNDELYWDKYQPKRMKLNGPSHLGTQLAPSYSCDSSGSFNCEECGKKFRNINNYEYHTQMH